MRKVLVYEPYAGGHRPEYLVHLIAHWHAELRSEIELHVLTPELNLDERYLLHGAPDRFEDVRWHLLPSAPDTSSLLGAAFDQTRTLNETARAIRPDHVVHAYLDHLLLPLTLGAVHLPERARLTGFLFRPTFHYAASGFGERIHRLRKDLFLRGALLRRTLGCVLTLDPFAARELQGRKQTDARWLPDPIPEQESASEIDLLPPADDRTTALLFGVLTARKGVIPLMDAALSLPDSAGRRLRLVLAGPLADEVRVQVRERAEALRRGTEVELVLHDAFVPTDAVPALIGRSDLVLLPYQRHVGMSAVLVRAARAGKPVLAQQYGLLGRLTDEHRLGLTSATDADSLRTALMRLADEPQTHFDPEAARRFADRHTPEAFGRTVWEAVRSQLTV